MKMKSTVILEEEEVDKLYSIIADACLRTYSTLEEQSSSLSAAKVDFETLLNLYLHKAFKKGKRLYKPTKKE